MPFCHLDSIEQVEIFNRFFSSFKLLFSRLLKEIFGLRELLLLELLFFQLLCEYIAILLAYVRIQKCADRSVYLVLLRRRSLVQLKL